MAIYAKETVSVILGGGAGSRSSSRFDTIYDEVLL